MSIQQVQNNLATAAFKMTAAEAREKHICIDCKAPIRDERGAESSGENGQIYSSAGMREYGITAMCETCFDNLFVER